MFGLFKKDTPSVGSVLFRGNLAPRAEEFDFLASHAIEVTTLPGDAKSLWTCKLRHRQWGDAELLCLKDLPPPPQGIIDHCSSLSDHEKKEAKAGMITVTVRLSATKENVLRDRKNLLRYLRAIMGDDGVVATDHASMLFWSRDALDEELQHDADLDISSLYCIHAVTHDDSDDVYWLHTHGLDRIGAFDFDILAPSDGTVHQGDDVFRALAFAILEGEARQDTAPFLLAHPEPLVQLIPAADFQAGAAPADRALRDAEDHLEKRCVLCEPRQGMLAKFKKLARPSRFFQEWDGGDLAIHFSKNATDLMARRARQTLPVLHALMDEFASLELPVLAKIGYPTDSGAGGGAEHLWFSVHAINSDTLDATLENQPFDIAGMKMGERGTHPVAQLTDWAIMSPAGQINPRSLKSARLIRERWDDVVELVRAARESNPE